MSSDLQILYKSVKELPGADCRESKKVLFRRGTTQDRCNGALCNAPAMLWNQASNLFFLIILYFNGFPVLILVQPAIRGSVFSGPHST